MRKLIKNHQVGIVLSGSCGWYTIHHNLEWVFLPELVDFVESLGYLNAPIRERIPLVKQLLIKAGYEEDLKDSFYAGTSYIQGVDIAGATSLYVEWVDKWKLIKIINPEQGEIIIENDDNWITV